MKNKLKVELILVVVLSVMDWKESSWYTIESLLGDLNMKSPTSSVRSGSSCRAKTIIPFFAAPKQNLQAE
ncbi:hypothetical protein HYC85_001787 [Camellia sinensis]|uniref:Uncharacterized protein n=1 Tax=Camellia sinensis TaxID=4442 RepID=A0A7J7I8S6_CAMSI|nr:hypothetical protein HYC85_001787 [Camellia sinensis]